jgi:hypothetical protein
LIIEHLKEDCGSSCHHRFNQRLSHIQCWGGGYLCMCVCVLCVCVCVCVVV